MLTSASSLIAVLVASIFSLPGSLLPDAFLSLPAASSILLNISIASFSSPDNAASRSFAPFVGPMLSADDESLLDLGFGTGSLKELGPGLEAKFSFEITVFAGPSLLALAPAAFTAWEGMTGTAGMIEALDPEAFFCVLVRV